MADRTEDLNKIVQIYQPDASTRRGGTALEDLSVYQRIALRVSSELDTNDLLMRRMELLSGRKEFSNDPTAAMSEISDLFQRKVTAVKSDMEQLKRLSEQGKVGLDAGGPHQHQHYKLIFQALNKRMIKHIESFQSAVKLQSTHVEQRTKRVADKYGQGASQISRYAAVKETKDSPLIAAAAPALSNAGGGVPAYAMFAARPAAPPPPALTSPASVAAVGHSTSSEPFVAQGSGPELRRRAGGSHPPAQSQPPSGHPVQNNKGTTDNKYFQRSPYVPAPSWTGGGGGGSGARASTQQQQQQQLHAPAQRNTARVRLAERAEAQIAQMGALFQQMAALVVEQSETISRIEDDVENGLVDTKEGHKHLLDYYERSKGNRSMILKIFALLAFFVILFLWIF